MDNGLTKADYRDLAERTPPGPPAGAKNQTEPPIPELQSLLAAPPPPALEQRLVSVSVPDADVPVRDVLIELARKVGVDLDLDSRISGGVIIYAKDRPFAEVIDRISELANLRYSFKNNVLHIELDTMYSHDYRIDILNATRKSAMQVATSTDVFSSVQGGGGGSGSNNSTSTVNSDSTYDPWAEISDNIKQIMVNSNPNAQPIRSNQINTSTSDQTPASVAPLSSLLPKLPPGRSVPPAPGATGTAGTAGTPAPAVPAATSAQPGNATSTSPMVLRSDNTANQASDTTGTGNATPGSTSPTTPATPAGNPAATPADLLSAASALGTNPLAAAQQALIDQAEAVPRTVRAAAAPLQAAAGGAPTSYFSVNKSAGIVSVFGTSRQQKLVQSYLDKVRSEASAQVLIEAKVVEVDLNDQFKAGVDWQQFLNKNAGQFALGTTTGTGAGFIADQAAFAKQQLSAATANPFTFSYDGGGNNFNVLLQFVQGFGSTRTLSSPRITVLNNQTAVLKVAQNQVYFQLTATVTSTPSTNGGTPSQTATYSSQLHTVPIGVVMTVQPSIDLDRSQVTMSLRPSVSVHSGDVADPAVALGLASACAGSTTGPCSAANISSATTNSNVPVVEVREMDSVVTVPSGEIVVMGGLMQTNTQKQETGVPGAADVPLLGNLFKVQSHETDVTELVIFLKASIIHGSDSVEWADKDLYKRYIQDPRPLAF